MVKNEIVHGGYRAYLIGQNAVDSTIVEFDHPIQPFELILVHGVPLANNTRLFVQTNRASLGLG